jgi:hypothetical protein
MRNELQETGRQKPSSLPATIHPVEVKMRLVYFGTGAVPSTLLLAYMSQGQFGASGAIGVILGSAAAYFAPEIHKTIQPVLHTASHLLAYLNRNNSGRARHRLMDTHWWMTGESRVQYAEDEDDQADELKEAEDTQAADDPLFTIPQADDTGGIERLSIEQIVRRVVPNSYRIWCGRSLTREGNPAVQLNIYKQHFRFMGASQRGKSSMVAAFLEIVTRTHDRNHVHIVLLDKENQTSNLFAHLPHIARIQIGGQTFKLHARSDDEVLEYLTYVVLMMNDRYDLMARDMQALLDLPILLVYIEEFLSLKNTFKSRMEKARGADAKEKATGDYKTLVYCIEELAGRGLKARVQLLLSAQVEYADDDFKEAMASIGCGFSFCIRPTAAASAGFRNRALLKRNAEENKVGQAVVETLDCNDLVLAPEYNLEKLLLALEQAQAQYASNIRPLRPVDEPTQGGNVARNDYTPDAQNTLKIENAGAPFARNENALRPDEKPTQTTQNGATSNKYRLTPEQVKMFISLYPDTIPNKDRCLEKVGANTAYRAHANEIIQQYQLDRKQG